MRGTVVKKYNVIINIFLHGSTSKAYFSVIAMVIGSGQTNCISFWVMSRLSVATITGIMLLVAFSCVLCCCCLFQLPMKLILLMLIFFTFGMYFSLLRCLLK